MDVLFSSELGGEAVSGPGGPGPGSLSSAQLVCGGEGREEEE